MSKLKSNAILLGLLGAAFGAAFFVGQPSANAGTSGYTETIANLRYNRHTCSAMCGETRFTGTSSVSGRTTSARMTGDLLSNGGSGHVRAHAGCGNSSGTTVHRSGWSSQNETVSTTCASGRSVRAHDCQIELLEGCFN